MCTDYPYRIYFCGDHAITVSFGDAISLEANQRVIALYKQLLANKEQAVLDIIPAYTTLTIVFDIACLLKQYPGLPVLKKMEHLLQDAVQREYRSNTDVPRKLIVPVCYDPLLAPDSMALAAMHGISLDELIQLHTEKTYHVYMIGFLPGFAYMGSVHARIISPRKQSPRKKVPAGSVGIAGEQTGIYPFDSPGGWQLIGQTPLKIFDATKKDPCYFQPGDEVHFASISLDEFQKMKNT